MIGTKIVDSASENASISGKSAAAVATGRPDLTQRLHKIRAASNDRDMVDVSDSLSVSEDETLEEEETSSSGSSGTDDDDDPSDDEDGKTTQEDRRGDTNSPIAVDVRTQLEFTTGPLPSSDLRSRLAAFLPRLKEANASLEQHGGQEHIDRVSDDEEHYIEMDLGLGVLKEVSRREGEIRTTRSDSSSQSEPTDSEDEDAVQKALREPKKSHRVEEINAG